MKPRILVGVILALFWGVTTAGGAERSLSVQVDFSRGTGLVPFVTRPGMEWTWYDAGVVRKFLSEMQVGVVRIRLNDIMVGSKGLGDFRKRLSNFRHDGEIREVLKRGGRVIVVLAPMPPWLATSSSRREQPGGWPVYQTSPPRDYDTWAQLVESVVSHFRHDVGVDLWYEVWNEPNGPRFWTGTPEQYLRLYLYSVLGARRADPAARIGGPAVASWTKGFGRTDFPPDDPERLRQSLIACLISYCSQTPLRELSLDRLPLNFISWHCYGEDPRNLRKPTTAIRGWLREAGFNDSTSLVIDEWNLWGARGWVFHPGRDTEYGAAYVGAMILSMAGTRLSGQNWFELQDWPQRSRRGEEFRGGGGLVTARGIPKASYNTMRLLSLLKGTAVEVVRDTTAEQPSVFASWDPHLNQGVLVLVNFVSRENGSDLSGARAYLKSKGLGRDDLRRYGVTPAVIEKYLRGEVTPEALPGRPDVQAALREARAVYQSQEAPVHVAVQVSGLPRNGLVVFRKYLVDAGHNNAYRTQARGGRISEDLTVAEEKVGNPETLSGPKLSLGPNSVCALVWKVESASPSGTPRR